MSASLLMDSKKLNTLQDDLESFFWLILFHILRYMRHNQPPENLEKTMSDIFDDSENIVPLGQEAQGGKSKFSLLMGDQPLGSDFAVTDNKALSSFFRHARDELTMWYTHVTRHQRAIANYAFDNDVPLRLPQHWASLWTPRILPWMIIWVCINFSLMLWAQMLSGLSVTFLWSAY